MLIGLLVWFLSCMKLLIFFICLHVHPVSLSSITQIVQLHYSCCQAMCPFKSHSTARRIVSIPHVYSTRFHVLTLELLWISSSIYAIFSHPTSMNYFFLPRISWSTRIQSLLLEYLCILQRWLCFIINVDFFTIVKINFKFLVFACLCSSYFFFRHVFTMTV